MIRMSLASYPSPRYHRDKFAGLISYLIMCITKGIVKPLSIKPYSHKGTGIKTLGNVISTHSLMELACVSSAREAHCWNCQIGLYTCCYERITIYPEDVGRKEIVKLAWCWSHKNRRKWLWTGKTVTWRIVGSIRPDSADTSSFWLRQSVSLPQCHICPYSGAIKSMLLTHRCVIQCNLSNDDATGDSARYARFLISQHTTTRLSAPQ